LPRVEPAAGDAATPTIRHLLTMTAGFAPAQRFA
jgi:CubicO group peptidase (beta-lactamase class C family)